MVTSYHGYLADYVELIRSLHRRGASTWAIAETLFEIGVRAHSSSPDPDEMSRADHLVNLRGMVIYVQRRLDLRIRRYRVLNLKVGGGPGDEPRRANSQDAADLTTTNHRRGFNRCPHLIA
jgi:hypothetical protein